MSPSTSRSESLHSLVFGLEIMPFGNSTPEPTPIGDLINQPACNPKGIVSSSPGLRGTSYPGAGAEGFSTPTGLCPVCPDAPQPRWGWEPTARFPKVARASRLRCAAARHAQPWALGRNPVGIQHGNCRMILGLVWRAAVGRRHIRAPFSDQRCHFCRSFFPHCACSG